MFKNLLRELLILLPFKVTKNTYYDRLTRKIIRNHLSPASNVVDVGCHKGEMMDIFLRYAPEGRHIGVEPIPALAENLRKRYNDTDVLIHEGALSDYEGTSSFNLVTTNPAYSGLKKRSYDRVEEDKKIQIPVTVLDNVVPDGLVIDLIKIDVEGGELGVLKGGIETLRRWHPILIFEHGKGAADHYGYGPKEIFDFLAKLDYQIYTLDSFIDQKGWLNLKTFTRLFENAEEYYFVAVEEAVNNL